MSAPKDETIWGPDVMPDLSREQAIHYLNGGAKADVELAFRDGVLVDYEKRVIGPAGPDLEIRLVFRHKSALPPEA